VRGEWVFSDASGLPGATEHLAGSRAPERPAGIWNEFAESQERARATVMNKRERRFTSNDEENRTAGTKGRKATRHRHPSDVRADMDRATERHAPSSSGRRTEGVEARQSSEDDGDLEI
jgi:hypothetical protein